MTYEMELESMIESRTPNDLEAKVLSLLLDQDFPGAPELREQLHGLRVAPVDDDGSLALRPQYGSSNAQVVRRVPVEGHYADRDGERVHVLLHVADGYLHELELFREDGEVVMQRLPTNLEEFVLDLW